MERLAHFGWRVSMPCYQASTTTHHLQDGLYVLPQWVLSTRSACSSTTLAARKQRPLQLSTGSVQRKTFCSRRWLHFPENCSMPVISEAPCFLDPPFLSSGEPLCSLRGMITDALIRIFLFSLAHPDKYYQLFLTLGVMIGLGGGIIYLPAIAVQSHHWRKHQALAIGVVGTGMY